MIKYKNNFLHELSLDYTKEREKIFETEERFYYSPWNTIRFQVKTKTEKNLEILYSGLFLEFLKEEFKKCKLNQ